MWRLLRQSVTVRFTTQTKPAKSARRATSLTLTKSALHILKCLDVRVTLWFPVLLVSPPTHKMRISILTNTKMEKPSLTSEC